MKITAIIVDDEPLARKLLKSHADRIGSIEVVAECSHALEALTALQQQPVELMFLDIQMPESNGLQLLKSLPHPPAVIFTTAYREYGADAFDLNAVDYLLKPIAFERFVKAVDKYRDLRIRPVSTPAYFFVYSNRKKVRIDTDQIMLVESLDDYVQIHLGDRVVSTRDTISSLETKLPADSFVRIHRSFIVNKRRVHIITGEGVEVANRFLPFGRVYKMQALRILGVM